MQKRIERAVYICVIILLVLASIHNVRKVVVLKESVHRQDLLIAELQDSIGLVKELNWKDKEVREFYEKNYIQYMMWRSMNEKKSKVSKGSVDSLRNSDAAK